MSLGPNDLLLSSGTLNNPPPAELVRAALAGGYAGVVLWPGAYLAREEIASDLAPLRRRIEDAGLVLHDLDAVIVWAGPDDPGPPYYEEAEEQLEIVIKDTLYESRPRAFVNLGLCRIQLKNMAGAKEAFSRALTMDRGNTIALIELAQIEFSEENWSASDRYLDAYRRLTRRQTARALWLGVRLADKLENPDAGASYALALRNLYPDSPEYQAYERAVQSGEL